MTDKEKIELIIQEKHLNNTQFCNEVCIAPGTLSHIRSGRTEPTLNILRSIAQAFPDINPAWLFYGEEPMYKKTGSSTPGNGEDDNAPIHNNNVEQSSSAEDSQLSLFPYSSGSSVQTTANAEGASLTTSSPNASTSRRDSASTRPNTNVLSVQEIVAETLKQPQQPSRKVVEVRIFFDDGTFETFSAH